MQIGSNTTGMQAGLTVMTDKVGREHCVVVIKGTLTISPVQELHDDQVAIQEADLFTGEPGHSAPIYECDYALHKPRCDVLLNGSAYAPGGRPTSRVTVAIQVGTLRKSFDVVGERVWRVGRTSIGHTEAAPFAVKPINYDCAFGGIDRSRDDRAMHRYYPENHAGVGYHYYTDARSLEGSPLPNTEEVGRPVARPDGNYRPMALGPVARTWDPRVRFAGTYDDNWRDNIYPFLPADFDERFFQAAPADQQIPYCRGGEAVRCINLTPNGRLEFVIPRLTAPVVYRFQQGDVRIEPNLDMVVIEPDLNRVLLTWRSAVPLKRKMHALREVSVGHGAERSLLW
jgi:hypothetical protein